MSDVRIGIGYDVHRIVAGRRMVLGGVEFDSPVGLDGHSDADAALHALGDALLGAAALGDIGHHFPPGDPRFRDADSIELLREVGRLLAARGYRLGNADLTVLAERPRIGPRVDEMRARIASALDADIGQISIKATTNERLGFVGREEGIAAWAVATIVQAP